MEKQLRIVKNGAIYSASVMQGIRSAWHRATAHHGKHSNSSIIPNSQQQ